MNEGAYAGPTSCGDQDWFKVQLDKGYGLQAEIDFSQKECDLDLWVVDEEVAKTAGVVGHEDALAYSVSDTDDESVAVHAVPKDGNYYIAVNPFKGGPCQYDMLVLVTEPVQCQDDSMEENHTPEQAKEVEVFHTVEDLMLCPGDEDWYSAYFYEGEKAVVDLKFTHASGDLELKMYDPAVTSQLLVDHQIAASTSATDNEHVEVEIPKEVM